jgi:hypothetical protein
MFCRQPAAPQVLVPALLQAQAQAAQDMRDLWSRLPEVRRPPHQPLGVLRQLWPPGYASHCFGNT